MLLATNQRDITSDFLVRELVLRKLDYYRWKTDVLPDSQITIKPTSGEVRIKIANLLFDIESASVAYFRHSEIPLPNQNVPEAYLNFVSTVYGVRF